MPSSSTQRYLARAREAALALGLVAASMGVLIAASSFTPATQPTGWVAAPEVSNFDITTGTETIYQTDYERATWTGNLYAYPIGTSGVVETAAELLFVQAMVSGLTPFAAR